MLKNSHLTIMFLFALVSSSKNQAMSLQDAAENEEQHYTNFDCRICGDSIFAVESKTQEISFQHEASTEEFKNKFSIQECSSNPKHLFHRLCLIKSNKKDNFCPICENSLLDEFKIQQALLGFTNYSKEYQHCLLDILIKANEISISEIFEFLNSNQENIILSEIKKVASGDSKYRNLAKMIEIFQSENNSLVFVSSFVTENNYTQVLTLFTEISFSSLKAIQLVKILINLSKILDDSIKQQFSFKILEICKKLPVDSLSLNSEEIFSIFEVFINNQFVRTFIDYLIPLFKGDGTLTIAQFITLSKQIANNIEIDEPQIRKIIFRMIYFLEGKAIDSLHILLDSILSDCNPLSRNANEMIDILLGHDFFEIFSDENMLLKLIIKYKDNHLFYQRNSFYCFIANQASSEMYSSVTLNNLQSIIIESSEFKENLINFLLKEKFLYISLISLVVNSMLQSHERVNFYPEINSLFSKIIAKYYLVVDKMISLNLKDALEAFIKFYAKKKREIIKTSFHINATVKAFYKFPDLSYLSYYFLNCADSSFSKSDIELIGPVTILENIFGAFTLENLKRKKNICNSFNNLLFYIVNFPQLIIILYIKGVLAESLIELTQIKYNLDFDEYNQFLIKSILKCKEVMTTPLLIGFAKKVFLTERDLIFQYLFSGSSPLSIEEKTKIIDFLTDNSDEIK